VPGPPGKPAVPANRELSFMPWKFCTGICTEDIIGDKNVIGFSIKCIF
jgi:hypothetical protein